MYYRLNKSSTGITRKDIYRHNQTSTNNHFSSNDTVPKYIRNIGIMSNSTAYEYLGRLNNFENFMLKQYDKNLNQAIKEIIEGKMDPYDVLSEYSAYLTNYSSSSSKNISVLTIKQRVVTAKNFLEYYDVDISPRKFKLKIKLPKSIRREKEALSKEDIVNILNACSDIRLKTYVMLLASAGCRATEALSIRLSDCCLDITPARIFIRGEYTKTRVDRRVLLTSETKSQLLAWIEYKYRKRRVCFKDEKRRKTITEYRTPTRDANDLLFGVYYNNAKSSNPKYIYAEMAGSFAKTLDRIGKGIFEDNKRRRKITLHSFRRYVKGLISDLGYGDFSEYFIGHIGSTYYQKTEKEKQELFRKIEPSLTLLDFPSLERRGADFQSKIDTLEQENTILRKHQEMRDDVLTSLSDQVSTLVQEIEILKKQK